MWTRQPKETAEQKGVEMEWVEHGNCWLGVGSRGQTELRGGLHVTGRSTRPWPCIEHTQPSLPVMVSSMNPPSLFRIIDCLLNVRYILNKIANPYSRSCRCPTHTPSTLTVSGKADSFLLPAPMTLYLRAICGCGCALGCHTGRAEVLGSECPACVALNQ